MGLPVFDKCCFCIELKTGCFIIGYLNLIGAIIMSVLTLLLILGGGVLTTLQTEDQKQTEAMQAAGTLAMVFGIIMLLFILLALAFCIVLLVGLHKDKPGHVKAYLIFVSVFLVMYTVSFLVKCFTAPKPATIIQELVTILLNIYFLLVIRSQHAVMKDGPRSGPAIYSSA